MFPRSVFVADAKLYNEANAPTLAKLGFITRIPGTLKLVAQVITQALTSDLWQRLDELTRYHGLESGHYGMAQRWLVVRHRRPWSAPKRASPKHSNGNGTPSRSNGFICKVNALRRLRRSRRPGDTGQIVAVSSGRDLPRDRTQILCW